MPVSPEAHLISSIVRCSDFKVAISQGVTLEMFHTFEDEWKWVEDYFARYRKSPTFEAFRSQFPDFRVYKTEDTPYFSDEVRKAHAQHQLITVMHEAAALLADGDLDTAIRKMTTSAIGVAATMGTNNDGDIFTDFTDVLADVEGRVARAKETGSAGIPFGFPKLDRVTGGANPQDSIIVAARLGQGKSWTLQYMATCAAAAGYTSNFHALEQSRSAVTMRLHTLLSSSAGKEVFKTTALMQGKDFSVKAYKKFLHNLKRQMPGRVHVSDTSRGKVSSLGVAAAIERNQPDIVYIDYITLLKRMQADWQGIAELSGEIKGVATSYNIPIISAAQLNRTAAGSRGEPADPDALAGSDSIGQDADLVITGKQISRSVQMMKLAKNRSGPGGMKWWVQFQPGDGIIREVPYRTAQELMDKDKDYDDAEEDE